MERLIDIETRHLRLLQKLLNAHLTNKTVWAYGSRVKWKADKVSDLDLVVWDATDSQVANAKDAFSESDLPFTVQLLVWENIPKDFQENIRKNYVVLQEGSKIPEGWREVALAKIAKINNGKRNSQDAISKGEYPLFDRSTLIKKSDKYLFDKEALIVPGEGKEFIPKYYCGKFDLHQRCYAIHSFNNDALPKFCYYFLLNNKAYFRGTAVGSTVLSLRLAHFQTFPIMLPPLPEQKAIAEILSSLDDKIDLLHRQNKTLEDMAQTLFRQWFVEDADEGWEEKPLGETVDITIGRTPPRKEFQWFSTEQEGWKWISIKDMAECGIYVFDTSEYLTQDAVDRFNIPIIHSNTVILSFKMTVGRVGITTEDMLSNEAIAQFQFYSSTPYIRAYLYFYLKTFRFDILGSTSSIVTSINTAMIKSLMVKIPDSNSMKRFENVSNPVFEKIYLNQSQIRTLEKLRDTLLPKLMSGEIRVGN